MAEKTRYSDEELQEFKELILEKLDKARKDYDLLKGVKVSSREVTGTTLRTLVLHSRYWKKEPLFSLKKRPAV